MSTSRSPPSARARALARGCNRPRPYGPNLERSYNDGFDVAKNLGFTKTRTQPFSTKTRLVRRLRLAVDDEGARLDLRSRVDRRSGHRDAMGGRDRGSQVFSQAVGGGFRHPVRLAPGVGD